MKTTVKTFICAFALAAASFTAQAGDKEAKRLPHSEPAFTPPKPVKSTS